MSLLAAAMAGGAAGMGTGLAQVGAQQNKLLDEQELARMRAELDMERERTVQELRHRYSTAENEQVSGLRRGEMSHADEIARKTEAWKTTDPVLNDGRRANMVKDTQAKLDVENDPRNVEGAAKKEGLIARAKSENTAYDLSPGGVRMLGKEVLGSNNRMTPAEASLAAYREGLKGAGRSGSGSAAADKLDPKDKALLSSLENDEKALARSIQSLTEKMLKAREKVESDSLGDPAKITELVNRVVTPYQAEIAPLNAKLAETSRMKLQFQIDKEMFDPEFVARKAMLSKDPQTVREVIEDSYQFGQKWGDKVKQVVDATGFLAEKDAEAERKSAGQRSVREVDAAQTPSPSLIGQARGERFTPPDRAAIQNRGQALQDQLAQQAAQIEQRAREALASGDRKALSDIQGSRAFGSLPKDLRTQIYQAVNR